MVWKSWGCPEPVQALWVSLQLPFGVLLLAAILAVLAGPRSSTWTLPLLWAWLCDFSQFKGGKACRLFRSPQNGQGGWNTGRIGVVLLTNRMTPGAVRKVDEHCGLVLLAWLACGTRLTAGKSSLRHKAEGYTES